VLVLPRVRMEVDAGKTIGPEDFFDDAALPTSSPSSSAPGYAEGGGVAEGGVAAGGAPQRHGL
jgi:hypothetical protein